MSEAEYYGWHNLRKNPNDFPPNGVNVICQHTNGIGEGAFGGYYFVQFRWQAKVLKSECIAWRYIEQFEEDTE